MASPNTPVGPEGSQATKTVSFAPIETSGHQQQDPEGFNESYEGSRIKACVTGKLTESPVESSPVQQHSSLPAHPEPQSSSSTRQDDLKSRLNGALQTSPYDKKSKFLPLSDLRSIITVDSVSHYASTYAEAALRGQMQTPQLVDYVFGPERRDRDLARHVFATLVLVDQPALIPGVVKENIRDIDLPLGQCNENGVDYQLTRKTDILLRPIKCCEEWDMAQRSHFDKIQYQVKPAFFRLLGKHRELSPPHYLALRLSERTVLPFTSYDVNKQIISGNSKVVRVKIHHAHHDFDNQENEYFAIKTLESRDKQSQTHFLLEVKALMKIRAKDRKHLVDILTTFSYDNKYHLLFRWASGGNLSSLWKTEREPSNYDLVRWLAQQSYGLANGLDGIHNARLSANEVKDVQPSINHPPSPDQPSNWVRNVIPSTDKKDCGRHGDIKPENILWFQQDQNDYGLGMLKISDFGLTTFHTAYSTKVDPKFIEATIMYAPPEYDMEDDISRPFDIWSLGCVYLEFITWVLLGPEGIARFVAQRKREEDCRPKFRLETFYALQENGQARYGTVKRSVTLWIRDLKGLPQCSPYMRDFLDYIEHFMIVAEKEERHKSGPVMVRMSKMLRRCRESEEYAVCSAHPTSLMSSENIEPIDWAAGEGDVDIGKSQKSYWASRLTRSLCCGRDL